MTRLDAMMDMIDRHRDPKNSWHIILNNHASTRPTCFGGALCQSVKECRTFKVRQGRTMCTLRFPNSFCKDDGIVFETIVPGNTQADAINKVCQTAVAMYLRHYPGQVVLRAAHWTISVENLMVKVNEINNAVAQVVPVHVSQTLGIADIPVQQLVVHPAPWTPFAQELLAAEICAEEIVRLQPEPEPHSTWNSAAAELMTSEIWAEENV